MSRSAMILTLGTVSVLNLVAFAVNLALPSRATVGGQSYEDLLRNSDFTRAVKSIAESCIVNVDIGKLKCQ